MAPRTTSPTLSELRAYAVERSLFPPGSLEDGIARLGFVQADPIRAPARAQDLILRHRVKGYRVGDLDRRYPELDIDEDHFVNYGFLPIPTLALMHPRSGRRVWSAATRRRAQTILELVRSRGEVHPREVEEQLGHGTVTNYWGGSSNATTQLLEQMHYRGMVRVVRREGGVRVYAARAHVPTMDSSLSPAQRADRLVAIVVAKYAPLPSSTLAGLTNKLRHAAPQLAAALTLAHQRARKNLPGVRIDGVDWVWPEGEDPREASLERRTRRARFLAPFDPVVWDRRRFELFWGWPYRFEAYTPVAKRKLGYYALPLSWGHQMVGWGNLSVTEGRLEAEIGYAAGSPPPEETFGRALDAELDRMRRFLGLLSPSSRRR